MLVERLEKRLVFASVAPFLESGGQVVMEAEHFTANTARAGKSWSVVTSPSGFVGSGAMFVGPNSGTQINTGFATTSPQLDYAIKFVATGIYRVWLRGHVAVGTDDSVHAGLDGKAVSTSDNISASSQSNWIWFDKTMDGPVATINVTSAGTHTLNLWMREDGFRVDRIVLTKSTTFVPSGTGPIESPHATVPPVPSPPPPPPPPPPPATGSASLDPEIDPPWNIRRLTGSGERAAWSPDGKKVAYIAKEFGDAMEVDLATGKTRDLTSFFPNAGFLRVQYLPDGNFLLSGPKVFKDANTSRYREAELWVLKSDLSSPATELNQRLWEGYAISSKTDEIAWAEGQEQYPKDFPNGGHALFTGDITYVNGVPTLVNKKQVLSDANFMEPQDFRDSDQELVFDRYILANGNVFGVNLVSGVTKAYRSVAGEYDEGEGIYPDGNSELIESSRDKGAGHQSNQYIDVWKLSLDGSAPFQRVLRFGDFAGEKTTNPVVSPDGRFIAFQVARVGDEAGIGRGIFVLDTNASPVNSQTIVSDGLSSTSGWTVANSSTTAVSANGNQIVIGRSADGTSASASIARTIDTSGFANISLKLTAFQSSASFESSDSLKIEVDTGAGFERLLTDGQKWQGIDNASGDEVAANAGQTSSLATGWLALQTSAANNKAVRIRITGTVNSADEKYFLDAMQLVGTPMS